MKKLLLYFLVLSSLTAFAQTNLDYVEWFVDNDPGLGMATQLSMSGQAATSDWEISLGNLPPGVHYLYMRVRDEEGTWGHTLNRSFVVEPVDATGLSKVEWFVANDPGLGQSGFQTLNGLTATADWILPSNISPGVHYLYLRPQDNTGAWGHTISRSFVVLPILEDLACVEYFIDDDPGFGEATSVLAIPGNDMLMWEIDVAGLAPGVHCLYIRAKDAAGVWGHVLDRCFVVLSNGGEAPISEIFYTIEDGMGNLDSFTYYVNPPQQCVDLDSLLIGTGLIEGETYTLCFTAINTLGVQSFCVCQTIILQSCTPVATQVSATICEGAKYEFCGDSLQLPGIYSCTLTNYLGCDSTVELNLSVLPNSSFMFTETICEGEGYLFCGQVRTQPGTYSCILPNYLGCDSIVEMNLLVHPNSSYSFEDTFCENEGYTFCNNNITQSGTYTCTLTNYLGCDSVITLNLIETALDTTVTNNGQSLLSNASGMDYQWLDCNDNFAAIPGAVLQEFFPNEDGVYAVEISDGNCSDTSGCHPITLVGTTEWLQGRVKIFPNPASNTVQIELPESSGNIRLRLFDILGRPLQEKAFTKTTFSFDLTLVPNGAYNLILESENGWTGVFHLAIVK